VPEELRERIAAALGWPVQSTYGFSLPTLKEVVKTVDADLAAELDVIVQSKAYVLMPPVKRMKGHFRDGHGYILKRKS
jgi:hypothetical protein